MLFQLKNYFIHLNISLKAHRCHFKQIVESLFNEKICWAKISAILFDYNVKIYERPYDECWMMYFSSFSAFAPEKLSIWFLCLMNKKVGMLETLYFMAKSSSSSTSTLKYFFFLRNFKMSKVDILPSTQQLCQHMSQRALVIWEL